MNSSSTISVAVLAMLIVGVTAAYQPFAKQQPQQQHITRRDCLEGGWWSLATTTTAAGLVAFADPVSAFEGSGSSAYAGRSPASRTALRQSYQDRVTADVRDFNALGAAIARGELQGDAWFFFFTTMPRQEPDAAGRTAAALVDLRGEKRGGQLEGGDGLLLANTFTKQGKPPDNTPAVKSFKRLVALFDPIEAAAKAQDVAAARAAWTKASVAFSQYLQDVGLPTDLSDPFYTNKAK